MAIITLNPVIQSIRGRIGNTVFYNYREKTCARLYVIPRNPNTESQKKVRRTFADAVKAWQSMDPDEKYKFNRKARNLCMSGYNLFISGYIKTSIIKNTKIISRQNITNKHYTDSRQRRIHSVSYPIINRNTQNSGFMYAKYSPG